MVGRGAGQNHGPRRGKELVDNALDACGRCEVGRLHNGFWVEDIGDGIDGSDEELAALFSSAPADAIHQAEADADAGGPRQGPPG